MNVLQSANHVENFRPFIILTENAIYVQVAAFLLQLLLVWFLYEKKKNEVKQ